MPARDKSPHVLVSSSTSGHPFALERAFLFPMPPPPAVRIIRVSPGRRVVESFAPSTSERPSDLLTRYSDGFPGDPPLSPHGLTLDLSPRTLTSTTALAVKARSIPSPPLQVPLPPVPSRRW